MTQLVTRFSRLVGGVFIAGVVAVSAQAQQAAGAFTATAVQAMPDGSTQTGRIMKSGQNMRLEMSQDGQRSIQIMRGGEGLAYLIDPQQKIFAAIQDPSIAQAVEGAANPCPPAEQMQAAQITCEQVGEGLISGITTQTWQIKGPQDQSASVVEWDTGRRRALAQSWPDGAAMALTFQAMQEVNGRQVEYWSSSLQIPGQAPALGGWWFDPELRVVVREQMPGGVSRELREINVGPVDPAMFLPPQGFQQVDPQQLAPQGAGQGGQ